MRQAISNLKHSHLLGTWCKLTVAAHRRPRAIQANKANLVLKKKKPKQTTNAKTAHLPGILSVKTILLHSRLPLAAQPQAFREELTKATRSKGSRHSQRNCDKQPEDTTGFGLQTLEQLAGNRFPAFTLPLQPCF